MIQRLTQAIVEYGIAFGKIEEEERDVYMYGYTLLLETGICLVFTGCIGLMSDMLFEVIIFSIIFIPLRSFGGGIHANKDWQCLLISVIVIIGYCTILEIGCNKMCYYSILILTIVGIVFSQSKLESIRYGDTLTSKVIVNIICIICILTSVVLFRIKIGKLAEGVLIAVFIWLISFFTNRVCRKQGTF